MKIKKVLHGCMVGAVCLFLGCAGESATKSSTLLEIQGKVIDGYIANAIICADLNHNELCEDGEPTVRSDSQGNYRINAQVDTQKTYTLLAFSGVDTATKDKFAGILKREIEDTSLTDAHITPITTLVAYLYRQSDLAREVASTQNLKGAYAMVSTGLGLNVAQLKSNPMQDVAVYNIT